MSRARTVKPEWLQDELLSQASDGARIMSIALILLADDYGNGRVNKLQQATQIFPPSDETPEALANSYRRFSEALAKLSEIRFIGLYQVGGQHYFSIRKWFDHQKVSHPGKPVVPGPPESLWSVSGDSPEALAKPSALIGSDLIRSDLIGGDGIAREAQRAPEPPKPEPPPPPARLPTRRERAAGDLMSAPASELAARCRANPYDASLTPVQDRPEVAAVNAGWAKAVGLTLRSLGSYSDRNKPLLAILDALAVASPEELARACEQAGRDDWCRGLKGSDRDPPRKRDVGCLSPTVLRRLLDAADATRPSSLNPRVAKMLEEERKREAGLL